MRDLNTRFLPTWKVIFVQFLSGYHPLLHLRLKGYAILKTVHVQPGPVNTVECNAFDQSISVLWIFAPREMKSSWKLGKETPTYSASSIVVSPVAIMAATAVAITMRWS